MDTHVVEGRDFRDSFSVGLLSLLKQEIAWVWVALRNRLSPGPTGKPGCGDSESTTCSNPQGQAPVWLWGPGGL